MIDKEVTGVDGDRINRPGSQRLLANLLDIFALAEVHREGDYVQLVVFAEPGHHHAGVEPAAVGENHLVPRHDCSRFALGLALTWEAGRLPDSPRVEVFQLVKDELSCQPHSACKSRAARTQRGAK